MRAIAQALGPDVDLRDPRLLRIELAIGEVSADQQQRVALLHGGITRGEADQAGHADIEVVVVLDMLLAAQRMDDRRAQRLGELDHLGMGAGAARAAHHGDPLAGIEERRQRIEIAVARPHHRRARGHPGRRLGIGRFERDIARDHHDGHAALGDGDADRLLENARQVIDVGDQLDIVRAFDEQLLGMGLLEVGPADLDARDVGGDRQHRHAAAMAVEQAVDQVQVARAAAAGAHRELAAEMRLGAGSEGAGLLVAHMHPFDGVGSAQRIADAVQRVAGDAVDALDARRLQGLDDQVGTGSRHVAPPVEASDFTRGLARSQRGTAPGCGPNRR